MQPAEEVKQLFEKALGYDTSGDVYNAIKLYKRIVKLEPLWAAPYLRLKNIYKKRQEWKPAYHYVKRALALEPIQSEETWWDLGIAATALKKWRIAKNVWNKFNMPAFFNSKKREIFSIYLDYGKQFELVWARPICPARAEIISIPQPSSLQQYKDIILYDRQQLKGHNIAGNQKLPVYAFLGHWKHSNYKTFSCELHTQQQKDIDILEALCLQEDYGFENWSNSALNYSPSILEGVPEYYTLQIKADIKLTDSQWIAIAAYNRHDVEKLLQHWRLISLKDFGDLKQHI